MKQVFAVAALVFFAGCSTVKVEPGSASMVLHDQILDSIYANPLDGRERVSIVRDSGFLGSGCNYMIFIDNVNIAWLKPAQRIDLYLPYGDHTIEVVNPGNGLCPNQSASASVAVFKGNPKAFRTGLPSASSGGGDLAIFPTVPPAIK